MHSDTEWVHTGGPGCPGSPGEPWYPAEPWNADKNSVKMN